MLGSKYLIFAIAMMLMATATMAHAQKPLYQSNMDWQWNNWDAGGSVDCPALYIAAGVPQFIVSGGRGAMMRYAQGVLLSTPQNPATTAYVYGLVLLGQCHNGDARQTLMNAGPFAVTQYLASMY